MNVLVTGGSASGKSAYAERLACALQGRPCSSACDLDSRSESSVSALQGRLMLDGSRMQNASTCIWEDNAVLPNELKVCSPESNEPPLCEAAPKPIPQGALVYVATMRVFGDEGAKRVARHRKQRAGKGFVTLECANNLTELVRNPKTARLLASSTVLLEDVGNLVANELFDNEGTELDADMAADAAVAGVIALASCCTNMVAVTNEVGADNMQYDDATQHYVRCLGAVSNRLAARFDTVIECVCGFPRFVKGGLT